MPPLCLRPRSLSRSPQFFMQLFFVAVLVGGCGGGGDGSNAISDGAVSSFAAGPITGFGSVIVNGTRFDVTGANVADDDDIARGENDLRLGMLAEIDAGSISAETSSAQAMNIRFHSVIVGPVDAINIATRGMVVLGQTVDVSSETVFDDRIAGTGIVLNDVLEIHGMLDTSTGRYLATRIEPRPIAAFFKLRGIVNGLDATARSFMIGSETISFASLPGNLAPADLANGLLVTAKLQPIPTTQGMWPAIQVKNVVRDMPERSEVDVRGIVTSLVSPDQFSVDGIAVDARGVRFSPAGVSVVAGTQVEVRGTANNGTIIASEVSIADHPGFELHGVIDALDPATSTFIVHGVPVSYGGGAQFSNGTQADLAEGVRVNVEGPLSADGTRLEAASISLER